MTDDISIYIPAYNAEKTIKECIDSILAQTIKPKKILIIDDNSNDKTMNILLSYGDKIEIINNKKNMGVSYGRNLAVNHLQTKYIASIDADVELSKRWIEILLSKLIQKKITLIGGRMHEKFIKNTFNLWRLNKLRQNWGGEDLYNPRFIFGCNNILDTSRLTRGKIYRDDLDYFKTNGEDHEFSKSLRRQNLDLYYSSEAICYHLQNDDGLSLSKRYWRYIYYGDGMKKRNFSKTLKNIIRQFKKTIKWSLFDLIKLNFKLILVNFIVLYYFTILDLKDFNENKIK